MKTPNQSELFTIRIWNERLGDGIFEWRGKVQHVLTGDYIYFHTWEDLVSWLSNNLETEDPGEPPISLKNSNHEQNAALR
jgi:hypothetical protein